MACDADLCVPSADSGSSTTLSDSTGSSGGEELGGATGDDTGAARDAGEEPGSSSSTGEPGGSSGEPTEDIDPCAGQGGGHYCGDGIGGDPGVLYECTDGETVVKHVGPGCPSCVQCPSGYADYCDGGFTPPFSCINGV